VSRHQYRNDERFLWYRCHNSGSPLQVGAAPDFSDLVFRICLASARGNCLPLRGGYPGALFVAEVPFPRVGHSLSQSVDQSQWQRKAKV